MACPPEQDPAFPTAGPSHRKLAQASYPHPSEDRQKKQELRSHSLQNENHSHRKLTKPITWITALCNSMKLQAMLCGATQDGRVVVERSDQTWSTGEGNGKPPQYSCLENPMNSMKMQKDRTLRDEPPKVQNRCPKCYWGRRKKYMMIEAELQ